MAAEMFPQTGAETFRDYRANTRRAGSQSAFVRFTPLLGQNYDICHRGSRFADDPGAAAGGFGLRKVWVSRVVL